MPMGEDLLETRCYRIDHVDPLLLYGVNNHRYNLLVRAFPQVQVVARGEELRVEGYGSELDSFERGLEAVLRVLVSRGSISDAEFVSLFRGSSCSAESACGVGACGGDGVLVVGPKGRQIRPLSVSQRELVELVGTHDLLFALGPAGTGKTYIAIALAVRALRMHQVRRIILTRPAVEAGERLGFLPGDLKEKLDPYLQPLYDALNDMLPPRFLQSKLEERVVQIAPLAYMRGRTLDEAFVILDEAQNATLPQLKMFLTRMGKHAKFIVTGDLTQVDLPHSSESGLGRAVRLVEGIPGVARVDFDASGIVRHPIVRAVVEAFAREEGDRGEG